MKKKLNKKNCIITLTGIAAMLFVGVCWNANNETVIEEKAAKEKIERMIESEYDIYGDEVEIKIDYFRKVNEYEGQEVYEVGVDWNDGAYSSTDYCIIQQY